MAKMRLTKVGVERAASGRHYDDKLPGFGVFVGKPASPGGEGGAVYRGFFFEYRPPSPAGVDRKKVVKRRISFGRYCGEPGEVDAARDRAFALLAEVRAGRDPLAKKDEEERKAANTVQAVFDRWMQADQSGNRSADEVRRVFERDILPAWKARPIEDIRKADVIALIDAVHARAPVMANRTLAHLRRMLNWAAGRGLMEANPAQFVEKPGREVKRDRVLDDGELAVLWRGLDGGGAYAAGVRLLLLTAARREEVFAARWSELTPARDGIRLPAERVKAGEARTLWLSKPAREVIAGLTRHKDSDWLVTHGGKKAFTNHGHAKADLDRKIAAIRAKAAGVTLAKPTDADFAPYMLPEWRLHDLRRTAATGLQRQGVRVEVTEAVLGHISGTRAGVAGIYQRHRYEAESREALELWGRKVARICNVGMQPQRLQNLSG